MLPACDGGEDAFGVGSPGEGLWVFVVFGDVTVDGGLRVDERMEDLRLSSRRVSAEKKPSTALSQDALVGVKWKVQRG